VNHSSKMNLPSQSILSKLPEKSLLQAILDLARSESIRLYIVGGTVRDIILGRKIYDVDFAIPGDAISFAKKLAELTKAKAIILDEIQNSARVIYNRGEFYMDFSAIRGDDIIADLRVRDLTINAIAYDFQQLLESNEVELMDPCNGLNDLNDKLIRFTSTQVIIDDPIRMLRALRFSASLDFTIPDQILSSIQIFSCLINSVAVERTRDELYKILNVHNSIKYIRLINDIGLLDYIFPEITKMRGVEQNEYHHLDVWEHSLLTLEFLEQNVSALVCENIQKSPLIPLFQRGKLNSPFGKGGKGGFKNDTSIIPESMINHLPEINKYLNEEVVKERSKLALLKLTALFHDIGKPSAKSIDEKGRIRFFDHHQKGAELALIIGSRLKLANRESQFMSNVILYHMYPLTLITKYKRNRTSPREKKHDALKFIKKVGDDCLGVLLISYADLQATQGPLRTDEDLRIMDDLIAEITDIYFIEMEKSIPPLLTGVDIMKEFKLPPSPIIGEIIKSVREAQLSKKIKTRQEAIELAKEIFKR
ncbi:MAG: HDIG domain-containing metalloprotein, partial [Candidatus Poribacteria bacterium]